MTDQIVNWLDEDFDEDISDADSLCSDHSTDSEEYISDEEPDLEINECENISSSQYIYEKKGEKYDRYKWCINPFPPSLTRQHNIITHLSGLILISYT